MRGRLRRHYQLGRETKGRTDAAAIGGSQRRHVPGTDPARGGRGARRDPPGGVQPGGRAHVCRLEDFRAPSGACDRLGHCPGHLALPFAARAQAQRCRAERPRLHRRRARRQRGALVVERSHREHPAHPFQIPQRAAAFPGGPGRDLPQRARRGGAGDCRQGRHQLGHRIGGRADTGGDSARRGRHPHRQQSVDRLPRDLRSVHLRALHRRPRRRDREPPAALQPGRDRRAAPLLGNSARRDPAPGVLRAKRALDIRVEAENAVELGHAKALADHAAGARHGQHPPGLGHLPEAGDERSDRGAVDVRDPTEIDDDLPVPLGQQAADRFVDGGGVGAEHGLAGQLNHGRAGFSLPLGIQTRNVSWMGM